MKLGVLALLAGLLVACESEPRCGNVNPTHPGAEAVVVDVGHGRVLSSSAVPYPYVTEVRDGVLSVVPGNASPTPIATVLPPPWSGPRLRRDGLALIGPGPSPWRLPGASGTHLGTVGGTAVVLGEDRQLRGVRLEDGTPLWNARLEHRLLADVGAVGAGVAVAAGGAVRADDYDHGVRVYGIDALTGRLLWTRSIPARFTVARVLLRGELAVVAISATDRAGAAQLLAVDRATGREVWSTVLPRGNVAALEAAPDGLLAVNAEVLFFCD